MAAHNADRRLRQRSGRRASLLLAVASIGALSHWRSTNFSSRSKQLPVKFLSASAVSDDVLAGFPAAAGNAGSLEMGLLQGVMKLSLKDPPSGEGRSAEVAYETPVPHVGNVGASMTSGGAWATSWNREIPYIGSVKAALNSEKEWSAAADATVGDVGIKAKLNSEQEWAANATAKVGDVGHVKATLNSEMEWSADADAEVGDVAVKAKLNSQKVWSAKANAKLAAFGTLLTSLNSEKEWSADLEVPIQGKFGINPAVILGATEAGMRVKAKAEHHHEVTDIRDAGTITKRFLAHLTSGIYQVQNAPGNYAAGDLVHDASVTYTSAHGSVTAAGTLDQRLKRGYKGSLTAATQTKAGKLSASVDLERYRLKADTEYGQLSAAIPHNGEDEKVFGLKVDHMTMEAKLKGSEKPRVRVEVTA